MLESRKLSYTSFLLFLNFLFVIILLIPLVLGLIFDGVSLFQNYETLKNSILVLICSLIGFSAAYYVLWRVGTDHHKIVFFSFVLIILVYILANIFFWRRNDFRYLINYFVEGQLLALLIYVAEIEKTVKH